MTTDAGAVKAGAVKTAAVLGCGRRGPDKEGWAVGQAHGEGYQKAILGVELYAVDPNAENLAAFGERLGVPASRLFATTAELYAAVTPDMVSVCTWPALHRPQVMEAVKAGVRGILCEKPMALDGSEIRDMMTACARAGTLLAVAHQRAYDGEFVMAKRLLDEGVLGNELVIEARVGDGWDILSWSVHWLDMASWLFGADATSVLAGVSQSGQRRYQHAVEDASVLFVEFPGKRQAIFVTGPQGIGGAQFVIRGTEGMMHIRGGVQLWTKQGYREYPKADVALTSFSGAVREMADALEAGRANAGHCDARRSSKATLLAFAAHESARTMKRVALPTHVAYPPLEISERGTSPRGLGRVVVIGDAHHYEADIGMSGRDGLLEAIESLRPASVHLVDADKREVTQADLDGADVLVIYHTQPPCGEAAREAIGAWVRAGKPTAIIHCGIGAYPAWQEYRDWTGLYWVWGNEANPRKSGHPHVPSVIEVVDGSWPVPWAKAWIPRDEVYIDLGEAADVRMLAVAKIGEATYPAAWQSVKQPNVAVWAPGHRADVWRLPALREGLEATIRLVCGAAKP